MDMERRMVWPPQIQVQTPLGIMRDEDQHISTTVPALLEILSSAFAVNVYFDGASTSWWRDIKDRWVSTFMVVEHISNIRPGSNRWLPRDIGRSSQFSNGHVVIQFGDTFDHDRDEKYLGVRDNTCAVIPDLSNPTVSIYPQLTVTNHVPTFIEKFRNEFPIPTKFWSFGGIVQLYEDAKGIIHGCTWFKMTRMTGMDEDYLRMGLARVEYNTANRHMRVSRFQPSSDTPQPDIPSWGYLCALGVSGWVYLYGQKLIDNKKKVIVLARFSVGNNNTVTTYWTGSAWSTVESDCQPILSDIEHGQIFPTEVFGSKDKHKYLFVGNSSTGDSRAIIARSETPQGPWIDAHTLPIHMYNSDPTAEPSGPFFYCVYPHPWAFGFNTKGMDRSGVLMVTWSEGGLAGNVLAASLKFNMEVKRIDDPCESSKGTEPRTFSGISPARKFICEEGFPRK